MNLLAYPHRRYNPLTGEWILVSPQRTNRPWQGQTEKRQRELLPQYDPTCYLCPGNDRAGGKRNPKYQTTFVFDNDFPALVPDIQGGRIDQNDGLVRAASERGICRVVCFSPRHDLTLPQMREEEIRRVVDAWANQTAEMAAIDFVNYVQVFENRGPQMGASNPHPHCQIWGTEHLPTEPTKELKSLSDYLQKHKRCLLCDYLELELNARDRIIIQNDHFVALVPFWATWPFETMVLSRRHVGTLNGLDDSERDALSDVIKRLTTRYDNLFELSFPYSMGFHQSPTDGLAHHEVHLHAHYYPPLLRSATVRKFMVGFEMLGNPQRDITPEDAAARLQQVSEKPYR